MYTPTHARTLEHRRGGDGVLANVPVQEQHAQLQRQARDRHQRRHQGYPLHTFAEAARPLRLLAAAPVAAAGGRGGSRDGGGGRPTAAPGGSHGRHG